jgi:NADPH2:quinone reductase
MNGKETNKEKDTMRAIRLGSFDRSPQLQEAPSQQIASNEILVRMHASSINAFDVAVATGRLQGMMEYQFPVTIGLDLAGVVAEVESKVSRYQVGDEVFGFLGKAVLHEGTWADYVASPEDMFVAPKPTSLDFLEAAALPVAGVAALMSVDALDPSEGDRVLVVGATGGVGSYAVQLAVKRGAKVIATPRQEDEDYLGDLGAAEAIDYTRSTSSLRSASAILRASRGWQTSPTLRRGSRRWPSCAPPAAAPPLRWEQPMRSNWPPET